MYLLHIASFDVEVMETFAWHVMNSDLNIMWSAEVVEMACRYVKEIDEINVLKRKVLWDALVGISPMQMVSSHIIDLLSKKDQD